METRVPVTAGSGWRVYHADLGWPTISPLMLISRYSEPLRRDTANGASEQHQDQRLLQAASTDAGQKHPKSKTSSSRFDPQESLRRDATTGAGEKHRTTMIHKAILFSRFQQGVITSDDFANAVFTETAATECHAAEEVHRRASRRRRSPLQSVKTQKRSALSQADGELGLDLLVRFRLPRSRAHVNCTEIHSLDHKSNTRRTCNALMNRSSVNFCAGSGILLPGDRWNLPGK